MSPTLEILLLQAQVLLQDADQANQAGAHETFDLQRQTRAVLAEAIDTLSQRRRVPVNPQKPVRAGGAP